MKKKVLSVVASVLSCSTLMATTTEFRTPLSLGHWTMHYPLAPTDDCDWAFNTWGAGYARVANKAYVSTCPSSAATTFTGATKINLLGTSTSTKTTTCSSEAAMSALWFGKDSFRGEEVFAGGQQIVPNNPWMSFAQITPRFTYSEQGVYIGFQADYRFGECSNWRFSTRGNLSVKVVETRRKLCAKLEETLADVIAFRDEINRFGEGGPNGWVGGPSFAFRLDFLSALQTQALGIAPAPSNFTKGPNFVLLGTATTPTFLGNVVVDDTNPDGTAPINLIKRNDGTLPTVQFSNPPSGTPLAADGSADDNSLYSFQSGTDYLDNLTRAAQGTLYVTPVVGEALFDDAITIRNSVNEMLSVLTSAGEGSAEKFFAFNNIDFCDKRITGLGDPELQFMLAREWESAYAQLMFGVLFPGASRNQIGVGQTLAMPTGAKGHFGIEVGLEGGWKVCDCFAIKLDGQYTQVLKRSELRAAPFTGATVRNIGYPGVNVNLSWGFFTGHIDFSVFHPQNENLGFDIGYEFFAKRADKINGICGTIGTSGSTATDLLGNTQTLDFSILTRNTNAQSHKVRGQVFHRWDYCELFAGASTVFAGKNAMKESEWHIGLGIEW